MKKDRNSFFSGYGYGQVGNMGMGMNNFVPNQAVSASNQFYAGPAYQETGMNNMSSMNNNMYSDIDSRLSKVERRLNRVLLNIIRQEKGDNECPFDEMDYDVQISHSPTDNMQTKTQVLQMLLSCGIHPLVAIKVCGLWTDAEKVFLLSKPYLDNLYKTIDDAIKEQGLLSQVDKANQLVEQFNNSKEQAATE